MKTTWAHGLSANPKGRSRRGRTLADLLRAVGEERVPFPPRLPGEDGSPDGDGGDPDHGRLMQRREALARVLWTRALCDGDLVAIRLLLEHLGAGGGEVRVLFTADDAARAETLLAGWTVALALRGSSEKPEEPA
jgi:hypothetical protein